MIIRHTEVKNSKIHYNPEAATLEYFQQHIAQALWAICGRQYEENMKANKEARHENVKIYTMYILCNINEGCTL